jgi:hypothetical protein
MKRDENGIEVFLQMSVYLTGFERADLQGTGNLNTFYNKLLDQYTAASDLVTLQSYFDESSKIVEKFGDDALGATAAITETFRPYVKLGTVNSEIITMWYMGEWGGEVINSDAYTQGLIWTIAEAHPPGAKQPGYGSWARKPR